MEFFAVLPIDTTWYPVMTVGHFNTTTDQSVVGGQLTLRQGGRIMDWSFFTVLPMDTTWYPVMTLEHFNTTSDQSVDGGQLTLRQGGRIIDWSFLLCYQWIQHGIQ